MARSWVLDRLLFPTFCHGGLLTVAAVLSFGCFLVIFVLMERAMARSVLDVGKVESLESIFSEIKKIEATELQEIAQEMFDTEQLSYLTFLPE